MYKLFGSFLAALVLTFCSPSVSALENHWIQSSGGDWHDVSNWSLGTVPTSADEVFIDAAGEYTVTVNASAEVQTVRVGGGGSAPLLHLAHVLGGNVIVEEGGKLFMDTGASVEGALTVFGHCKWFDGVVSPSSICRIEETGFLEIVGTADKNVGNLYNFGHITWNCEGIWIQAQFTTFLNVDGAETLFLQNCSFQGPGIQENPGTFVCGAGRQITLDGSASNPPFYRGIFQVPAESSFVLVGTHRLGDGVRFEGEGVTKLQGFIGGEGTFTANSTVQLTGTLGTGNIIWRATWDGTGELQWLSGTLFGPMEDGPAYTVISSNFTMRISNETEHHYLNHHAMTNQGTAIWEDGYLNGFNGEFYNEGTMVVSTGLFIGTGDFYNSGTIQSPPYNYSRLESLESWNIHNAGVLSSQMEGGLRLQGSFLLNEGTRFDGDGTTTLAIGTFGGSGTLTVDGVVKLDDGTLVGEHVWTGPGRLEMDGGDAFAGSTVFSNDFHVQMNGGITYLPSGTVTNKGTITLDYAEFNGSGGTFYNEGTIVVYSAQLTGSGDFYNSGTVMSPDYNYSSFHAGGTWTFHNSGIFYGGFEGNLELLGNLLLNDGTTFDGPGKTVLGANLGGAFGGSGTITVNGVVDIQNGTLVGEHVWTGPGRMESSGGGAFSGSTVFSNDFHVQINGGITYLPSGSVTNRGTITIDYAEFNGSGGSFYNEGTVVVSSAQLTGSGDFYNSGTLMSPDYNYSSFQSGGAWSFHNSGIFYAGYEGNLELYGSFLLGEGTTFNGPGKTILGGSLGGTFGGSGTITVNGTAELQNGTMVGEHVWTGPGRLDSNGGGAFAGSTTFSNDFHVQMNGGIIYFPSGFVTNQGTITIDYAEFNGSGGDIYNDGTIVVSSAQLSGSGNFYNSRTMMSPDYNYSSFNAGGSWSFHNSGIFNAGYEGNLELYGSFLLGEGTAFNGPGKTIIGGSLGGTFGGSGTITVNGTAELQNGTMVGEHVWTGPGVLESNGGGSFAGRTTFSNDFHVQINGGITYFPSGSVINQGTITLDNAEFNGSGGEIHNEGTAIVHSMQLTGSGNFYNPGTLLAPDYSFSSVGVMESWTFHNSGTFHAETSAFLDLSGSYHLNDGTTFNGPGKTTLADGSFGGSGTITVNGLAELTSTVSGEHIWTGPGELQWSSGGFSGPGATTFDTNLIVRVEGLGSRHFSQTITNFGTVGFSGPAAIANSANFHNMGKFIIGRTGGCQFLGSSNFYNVGFYEQDGPVNFPAGFVNSGVMNVKSGITDIFTYSSSPDAVLQFSLGGTLPGLSHGRLDVGILNAAGSLDVTLAGGFTGAEGDAFELITYTGVSGTFGGIVLPDEQWTSQFESNRFVVRMGTPVAPTITTGLESLTVAAGSNLTFTVEATGTPLPTYIWSFEGNVIADATSTTLTLTNVQPGATGTYSVVATNLAGSASSSAVLTVLLPPAIIVQPVDQAVVAGSNVTLTAVASGDNLQYQWFFNNLAVASATNSSLLLENVQPPSAGNYHLTVENAVGSTVSSNALLTVNLPAHITAGPQNQTVVFGSNVLFSVEATGTGTLFYQWQHNGGDIAGATSSVLSLTNVQSADEGSYGITVTNAYGSASSSATLTVQQTPFIITQPADQTVVLGSNATFAVEAGGDGTLTYQWFFKNDLVTGATDSTFVQEEVHATLGGDYHVVVSNPYGVTTSEVATLEVAYTNNPFLQAAGVYNGLFHEVDAIRHESAGYFVMSLRTNTGFSGKLLLNGNSVSFSGKFPPQGATNKTVLRTKFGKAPVTVSLRVDFGMNQVVGTVSSSNWVADVVADRGFYNNTNLATNFAGKYTILVPGAESSVLSPSGYSYGAVTVRTNGRLSLSGYGADKHAIKQSTVISQNGNWPFFSLMYRSTSNVLNGAITVTNRDYRGFMLGWLTVTNASTNSPRGTVSWIKAGWTNNLYAGGFTNEAEIIGSTFVTPAKGDRVVAITNGVTSFFDGGLALPVSHSFILKTNNTVLTSSRTNLSLSISSKAGSFKGTFRDPATGTNAPFFGALLQQQNIGAGFFVGTNEAGLMQLEKE